MSGGAAPGAAASAGGGAAGGAAAGATAGGTAIAGETSAVRVLRVLHVFCFFLCWRRRYSRVDVRAGSIAVGIFAI